MVKKHVRFYKIPHILEKSHFRMKKKGEGKYERNDRLFYGGGACIIRRPLPRDSLTGAATVCFHRSACLLAHDSRPVSSHVYACDLFRRQTRTLTFIRVRAILSPLLCAESSVHDHDSIPRRRYPRTLTWRYAIGGTLLIVPKKNYTISITSSDVTSTPSFSSVPSPSPAALYSLPVPLPSPPPSAQPPHRLRPQRFSHSHSRCRHLFSPSQSHHRCRLCLSSRLLRLPTSPLVA